MTPPHDPLGAFRDEAVALLQEALHSLRWDEAVPDVPDRLGPAPPGKGDFAYPCFPLARIARKAPGEIAREVADALPGSRKLTWTVEGAYVNFAVPESQLVTATLAAVAGHSEAYGTLPSKDTSVVLEHTSANPNGPFHVGRARNPIVGDTMARVLRAAGYTVTTEYYVNDMGKQVAILAWGLKNLDAGDVPPAEREKADHRKVAYYQKANKRMEEDPKVAEEINGMLKRFEHGDEDVGFAFREAASRVLDGMRESLARLNVRMDSFFSESDLVLSGDVQKVVAKLKESKHAAEEDGAWYLELESFGIKGKSTKWFFQRKDGTSLYTCRDLAYHRHKFQRADRVVNILGEDHKLAMQQLAIALGEIGEERQPEVVWISFVSLPEGKMSTRRGRVVFIDDLMDEAVQRAYEAVKARRGDELTEAEMRRVADVVGLGALRFNVARVQTEKSITFRWEDALNFEGDSAPFVQYAHARACSILRKADASFEPRKADAGKLTHESEVALAKTIARFPGVIAQSAQGLKVHPVAAYASELAAAFNAFYRDCQVLVDDAAVREARLALVAASRVTLARALDVLGVTAPDAM